MSTETDEKVISIIDNIDNPGITISEVGYGKWLIVFTNVAIYFVKISNSTSVHNPFGLVGLLVETGVKKAFSDGKDPSKMDKSNLTSILENARKYYKITFDQLNKIETKDNFFVGRAILLKNVEKKTLSIAIKKDQLQAFLNNFENYKKYGKH